MSKQAKFIFLIVNILFFAFNFFVVEYMPNPILFGWLPLQMLCWFGSAPLASIIWGIYYKKFFATQKDI